MNYSKYYKSSSYYGSDKIIKKYLKLNINKNLPIVIPHGVDYFQHENYILDSSSLEPKQKQIKGKRVKTLGNFTY